MKLFCFTYAGGSSDFYNPIKHEIEKVNSGVKVIALDYPGHGSRRKEVFATNFDKLSEDMVHQIRLNLDGDKYALMGYSMGSIVVVEVLKKIISEGRMELPQKVFLAAHEPKTLKVLEGISKDSQENILKERTISFGAVPDNLVNNKTFWRMYMPLYKADYSLIGQYDFDKLKLAANVAAIIFYSEMDTPFEEMQKWSKYYLGNIEYFQFTGNHFFIKEHVKEIADIISSKLSEVN